MISYTNGSFVVRKSEALDLAIAAGTVFLILVLWPLLMQPMHSTQPARYVTDYIRIPAPLTLPIHPGDLGIYGWLVMMTVSTAYTPAFLAGAAAGYLRPRMGMAGTAIVLAILGVCGIHQFEQSHGSFIDLDAGKAILMLAVNLLLGFLFILLGVAAAYVFSRARLQQAESNVTSTGGVTTTGDQAGPLDLGRFIMASLIGLGILLLPRILFMCLSLTFRPERGPFPLISMAAPVLSFSSLAVLNLSYLPCIVGAGAVIARADPHRTVWMAALIAVGMAAINASLNHWQLAHSTAYVHGMSNGSIFGSAIFFIRSTLYYTAVLSAISWLAGHWPARISDFTQVGAYPAG